MFRVLDETQTYPRLGRGEASDGTLGLLDSVKRLGRRHQDGRDEYLRCVGGIDPYFEEFHPKERATSGQHRPAAQWLAEEEAHPLW